MLAKKLNQKKKNKSPKGRGKVRTKKANPVKTSKSVETKYRRALDALVKRMRTDIKVSIIPLLRKLQPEYLNDGYAQTLEEAFDGMRKGYSRLDRNAKAVSSAFVEGADTVNKARFYKAIENAIGVDVSNIVKNEGLGDILAATTRENVNLIKSIPSEYFSKIETIVFTNTTQGSTAGSMIQQIQKLNDSTAKRAKLIARDQSSKINSALNRQRQQNLGVEEYIWRTSDDERVRADHKSKNGKTFRWDDPPKDTGHPGTDVQCRCIAQPIIKI